MKAVALKSTSDIGHPKGQRNGHINPPPVSPWFAQLSSIPGAVIQRKVGCACGGGCAECKEELDEHNVQPKLTISTPGDPFEQEADRVADQVMGMPVSTLERKCACDSADGVDAKCEACRGQPPSLQRKASEHSASGAPPSIQETLRQSGQPLDSGSRDFMESRFGRDFGDVRVHTDSMAAESAASINALAYTSGNHVVFNSGRYAPSTDGGKRLLAHELVHILQQQRRLSNEEHQPVKVHQKVGDIVQRSLLFESTVHICHNVLETRSFNVSNGGIRVVLLLDPLPLDSKYCHNHKFWVELSKKDEWLWIDDDISTCESETGGARSFSIGGLSKGTHYLTISRAFDNPYCCLSGDILVFDEPVSNDSTSCERDKDPSALDIVHGALDLAGFIPVLGAIPDGINAGIYALEGDWANAGLSAVAMVPAWGDGVKLGAIAGKNAIKISEKAALRLGEEGIAKGIKEVRAASKIEKAGLETVEEGGKAASKLEKEAEEAANAASRLEKEAAEEALKARIADCVAIWAGYKALGDCRRCKASDTLVERAAKIACITAVIAGRQTYLSKDCDDVLPGSIARGSEIAKRGHRQQLVQFGKMLADCQTLPTT
jgi:hypothetical protein